MKSAFIAYAKGTREDSQADLTVIPNHLCQLPTPTPLHFARAISLARLSSPDARVTRDTTARYLTSYAANHPAPKKTKNKKTSRIKTAEDSCAPLPRPSLFLSLQCNKRRDFTLVSHSPPAFTSLRLPVACLFEGDLISHIRTSIFLKRAKENCFDPFSHEREPGNLRNPLH